MFDTLLESNVPHRPQVRSSLIALFLHVAVVVGAISATAKSHAIFQPLPRDTIRLDLTRSRNLEPRPSGPTTPSGETPVIPAPPPPAATAPSQIPALDLGFDESPFDAMAFAGLGPGSDSSSSAASRGPAVWTPTDVDMLPQLASQLQPHYPEVLRRTGVSGEVLLEYVVGSTGRVDSSSVRILRSSHPGFSEAALEALRGAHFRPARRSGRPVAVLVQQTIRFEIR
jgi:periplasmic protein TonB